MPLFIFLLGCISMHIYWCFEAEVFKWWKFFRLQSWYVLKVPFLVCVCACCDWVMGSNGYLYICQHSNMSRIAVWLLLQCKPNNFFTLLATVCSSWVGINNGTSRRSILLPEGREDLLYIQIANGMAARLLELCIRGPKGGGWLCGALSKYTLPKWILIMFHHDVIGRVFFLYREWYTYCVNQHTIQWGTFPNTRSQNLFPFEMCENLYKWKLIQVNGTCAFKYVNVFLWKSHTSTRKVWIRATGIHFSKIYKIHICIYIYIFIFMYIVDIYVYSRYNIYIYIYK